MKVPLHPRRSMTKARKTRIWNTCGGLCAWCANPVEMIGPGVRYDHRVPLALGGADEDHNIRPLHTRPCDAAKTVFDRKAIAKALRIIARNENTRRLRKQINSPGFSATLTRGFDGKVRAK